MYTVPIFPWLELEQRLTADDFELIPFEECQFTDDSARAIVTHVVGLHLVAEKVSPQRATIAKPIGRPIGDELSGEERHRLFDFAELLAFVGLSTRKLFNMGQDYCSRDNFLLSIFDRSSLEVGFSHRTRRRDGSSLVLNSSPRFHRPEHIAHGRVAIDRPLFDALLGVWADPTLSWWPQVFESIMSYNVANTDSSTIPEHFEIISLLSAFQRLLDSGSNERRLQAAFHDLFRPKEDLVPGDTSCARLAAPDNTERLKNASWATTVREAWLHDLCVLRDNVAHGKIEPPYRPIWSRRNHLLLASYAFPLLTKCYLDARGVYQLSENDQFDIDIFERQACEEHFDEFPDGRYRWTAVRRRARWRQRFPWLDESDLD